MKKIVKRISLFVIAVIAVLYTTACGNSNSIVGTWEYYQNNSARSDIYYQFNKDKINSL